MQTINRNYINGKPLEFGNRDQIWVVRTADDKYNGIISVAEAGEGYDELGSLGEMFAFPCIRRSCNCINYFIPYRDNFRIGDEFECEGNSCDAKYRVGDDYELYHIKPESQL